MEGYVSISSFPEWAKLSTDVGSKEEMQKLAQVLNRLERNWFFFTSRFREGHEFANDSVALWRCITPESPFGIRRTRTSTRCDQTKCRTLAWDSCRPSDIIILYNPTSLRDLEITLSNLGKHSEALPINVKLCRDLLVSVDQISHTPTLALSLRRLSVSLTDLG
ncbi:uncharacterized protein EI90DRAFT_2711547 [Cantharellus anzutake]|uniref:uncharacterized protein n=1 Tax=Cantharellus anzutake TaxID=1750568 RepID=UPI00190663D0|nr:uncharacterized protein EI90DRAFT_2711547 [Cantharellus anzutake]KAF8318336.1 hypothetical protein EI90DRAFT_2711547 [Cantharellus anzutake]